MCWRHVASLGSANGKRHQHPRWHRGVNAPSHYAPLALAAGWIFIVAYFTGPFGFTWHLICLLRTYADKAAIVARRCRHRCPTFVQVCCNLQFGSLSAVCPQPLPPPPPPIPLPHTHLSLIWRGKPFGFLPRRPHSALRAWEHIASFYIGKCTLRVIVWHQLF